MTKEEMRDIIYKCAVLYDKNLCNKQVMFVYRNADNRSEYTEVQFRQYNFMHFTGVISNNLSAKDFYRRALNHKLHPSDFSVGSINTEMKLRVLPTVMNIDYSARMIGDYNGPHIELYTEKVAGTVTACLGLIRKGDCYIPNSVLNEDIRSIIPKPPGKIYAIFKKQIGEKLYTQLVYKSKDIATTRKCIPENVLSLIDGLVFADIKSEPAQNSD